MLKLAAIKSQLKQRVVDARSKLRFDHIEGQPPASANRDDGDVDDPSRMSRMSFDYEGVGNGQGPIIGGGTNNAA